MAKLLGQEIVTQAEFDEFRDGVFNDHAKDLMKHSAELSVLTMFMDKANTAALFSKISLVLSTLAIIASGFIYFSK